MNKYLILALACVFGAILISLVLFVKPKKQLLKFNARVDNSNNANMFYFLVKVLALVVFVFLIYRVIHNEVFEEIRNRDRLFTSQTIIKLSIYRTMLCGSIFLLLISPWFNYRPYQDGVCVFGTIGYLVNIFKFNQNIQAMQGIIVTDKVRSLMFALELIIGLGTCILYIFKRVRDYINKDYSSYKDILFNIGLGLVFFVLFSVLTANSYLYENLFDLEDAQSPKGFNKTHILLIVGMLIFTLAASITFKVVKNKMYLHAFLATLALVCLIDYVSPMKYAYLNGAYWKLPLHLCNTGVFLMFVSFTIKSKPIFYFNYLVNIVGALFAIFMPDYNDTVKLLTSSGVHFWYNHIILFVLPIVAVAGGFYERPKLKFVGYSIIVFICYFILVAFLDAIWQDQVNFFFLNGDSIIEKFVFSSGFKSEKYTVWFNIGNLEFRVFFLYWPLVFVFYIGFIFGAWFVFASLYQISDGYEDLIYRSAKNARDQKYLKKQLKGRALSDRLHPDNKGKVIISNFSKIYSGETDKSVDNLSLEIKPGTVFGFLGHNGAGKSTTIKSLVGIQTITEGNIEIDGYDLTLQPLEAKMQIGYVSDNHTVYDNLTGREYINYVADLYLVSEQDRNERIEKYVKMFKLEDAIDREIKGYSHGMKQKIVVIASLIHEPKIWVLDEPLTGLDPTSSHQIKTIMKEYASKGNIVFFSSHVIEVVEKICDEIAIIGHGKLVGTWKIKDLEKDNLTLQDLYVKYVTYKGGEENV